MTDVGCAKDKCCGNRGCRVMRPMSYEAESAHCHEHAHRPEDCSNYVPKMKFAGFGRAYIPRQRLCELFSGKEGFVAGTIFPELYMPYEGRVSTQNLECEEGDDFA